MNVDEFTVRVLLRGVDGNAVPLVKRDLSFMGKMSAEDARAIEETVALMHKWGLMDQLSAPID